MRLDCLRILAATLALMAASAGSAIAEPADTGLASQNVQPPAEQWLYCATVIHRDPVTKESSLKSRNCSTDRNSAALEVGPASTLLMTFFEDANFIGYYDSVWGDDGACDSSGYGFSDLRTLNALVAGISSYYYYNNCDAQQYYRDIYYGGTRSPVRYGDRAYVGDTWNDHLYSIRIWNG